jgi:hypothetical protein
MARATLKTRPRGTLRHLSAAEAPEAADTAAMRAGVKVAQFFARNRAGYKNDRDDDPVETSV